MKAIMRRVIVESPRRAPVRWVRYVRHERVDAFLRCGWMAAFDIGGSHREWSVGMAWLCECPMREPGDGDGEGRPHSTGQSRREGSSPHVAHQKREPPDELQRECQADHDDEMLGGFW